MRDTSLIRRNFFRTTDYRQRFSECGQLRFDNTLLEKVLAEVVLKLER